MLTASLQSTWESQRAKQQRPKYSNPYGSGYDEGDVKHSAAEEKAKGPTLQAHHYRSSGDSANSNSNYSSELPNLKMPQVRNAFVLYCSSEMLIIFLSSTGFDEQS